MKTRIIIMLLFMATRRLIAQPINGSQRLSIKPARTVSFTTTEGSFMDVDVSPDGETLLFDMLGDLYTVPVSGGKANQITRGLAHRFYALWSPNNKMIAYVSDYSGDYHVNIQDVSGRLHRVLGKHDFPIASDRNFSSSSHLFWSPDSKAIGIGSFVKPSIADTKMVNNFMYQVDGGKASYPTYINFEKDKIDHLQFSSNGQLVYAFETNPSYDPVNKTTQKGVIQYDRKSGAKLLLSKITDPFYSAVISPDAHWLAYIKDLSMMKDSGNVRTLVLRNLSDNKETVLISRNDLVKSQHYAFSPDSKMLYIGYGGHLHRIYLKDKQNEVIPFTARVKMDMGAFDYHTFRVPEHSLKVKYTRYADKSPDGKHLVFMALNKLYAIDLPIGKPHLLVDQPMNQLHPVYSPDSKWIAYVTWSVTKGGALYKVPASGGNPVKLTNEDGQFQFPVWSPDGKSIAFFRQNITIADGVLQSAGHSHVELIPTAGVAVAVIDSTNNVLSEDNILQFSSDSRSLIYLIGEGNPMEGQFRLISKSLDGGAFETVANFKSNLPFSTLTDLGSKQIIISPDRRYLVYRLCEDLYLLPFNEPDKATKIYDFSQNQRLPSIRFSPGVDPQWGADGKTLNWNYANKFYEVDPDKIVSTAAQLKQNNRISASKDNGMIVVPVIPDDIVNIDLTVPRYYGHGLIALKNARIITMHGNQVIARGTIIIKNGRFTEIGATWKISIPPGATIIDLNSTTLMPGFVDIHDHFHRGNSEFENNLNYQTNLAYGVTTARDPSSSLESFGTGELLATGQVTGPRLFSSGVAVRSPLNVESLADARNIVRKRAMLGGTFIKQYLLPTRQQRQWLLMASNESGLNMTNEGSGPMEQLMMMRDGSTGVEHMYVAWENSYSDVKSFVSKARTFWTPTLQQTPMVGKGERIFDQWYQRHPDDSVKLRHFSSALLADILSNSPPTSEDVRDVFNYSQIAASFRKQGASITMGAHGNQAGIGSQFELWALQMGGLTNIQALQAATIMGAQALGMQKDLGSIEVGKIADLIILNKNPLDDIHNSKEIRYVMKDGILYDGNTLDIVWPKAQKHP